MTYADREYSPSNGEFLGERSPWLSWLSAETSTLEVR